MATLSLFPTRIPFVDDKGCLTPEAYRALKEVFSRIGGPLGDTGIDVFAPFVASQDEMAEMVAQPIQVETTMPPDIAQPAHSEYGPFVEMVMQPLPVDTLTGVTLDACIVKGTWTASGTWTLPAHSCNGDITMTGSTAQFLGTQAGITRLRGGPTGGTDPAITLFGSTNALPAWVVIDGSQTHIRSVSGTDYAVFNSSGVTVTNAFGCNGKTAQSAYASGGAIATTGATNTTPYGFTTAAQANGIVTLVNNIRSALVANGIMS